MKTRLISWDTSRGTLLPYLNTVTKDLLDQFEEVELIQILPTVQNTELNQIVLTAAIAVFHVGPAKQDVNDTNVANMPRKTKFQQYLQKSMAAVEDAGKKLSEKSPERKKKDRDEAAEILRRREELTDDGRPLVSVSRRKLDAFKSELKEIYDGYDVIIDGLTDKLTSQMMHMTPLQIKNMLNDCKDLKKNEKL